MSTTRDLLGGPVACGNPTVTRRRRSVGVVSLDLTVAAVLAIAGACLVGGVVETGHPHGGAWAALAMVLIVAPVSWARRGPVSAAVVFAAAVAFNAMFVGTMVRCGVALPAAFWIAFMIGLRCHPRRAACGIALMCAGIALLTTCDPAIAAPGGLGIVPVAAAFWLTGRVCQDRESAIEALAERNAEITAQRQRTADLAVRVDRARIRGGLSELLGQRLAEIAATAGEGRDHLAAAPDAARAALTRISEVGRDALAQMREVVGLLRDDVHTAPQPGIDDLPTLIGTRSSGVRFCLVGDETDLPGGTQLAVYRIVECLLETVSVADTTVDIRCETGAVAVRVTGVLSMLDTSLAVSRARQWVALHGGTLAQAVSEGRTEWLVRVPAGFGRV